MKYCSYGCGNKAIKKLKNGKFVCSPSINQCPALKQKNAEGQKRRDKYTHSTPHHLKGKTYEEFFGKEKAIKIKEKKSKKTKELFINGIITGKGSTELKEIVRKRRISIKAKLKCGGYRKGSGIGKSGWCREFWCDSSYELAFVLYCTDNKINIVRNKQGFEYRYQNKTCKYYPDFILDSKYIEIKGYLDDKNRVKIDQFQGDLKVITHPEINFYLEYAKSTYGVNFIDLYN